MRKPKWWGSSFSEKVIKAYNDGIIDGTEESMGRWFDNYNAPLGHNESDIRDMRDIIRYYEAGNRLAG